jgi:hypothetical protein
MTDYRSNPSGARERGPEKPFDPKGGTIYERGSGPLRPGQMPAERKEGNRGGPERRG